MPFGSCQRAADGQAAFACRKRVTARPDEEEFLAADAAHHFARAQMRLQHLADLYQREIADLVAEPVVDGFEVIDVDHRDGEPMPAGKGFRYLPADPGQHLAAVGNAREMVGLGQDPDFGCLGLGPQLCLLEFAHGLGAFGHIHDGAEDDRGPMASVRFHLVAAFEIARRAIG